MSFPHREFLGWSHAVLPSVADRLLERFGEDLSALSLVLPGRRAGRRLTELLLERASASWSPPTMLTMNAVLDRIVPNPLPWASPLERTLCWGQALRGFDIQELKTLTARPKDLESPIARWALAESLDGLQEELAGSGYSIADVLGQDSDGLPFLDQAPSGEVGRWNCLKALHLAYRECLEKAGLADRQWSRLLAWKEGRVQALAGPLLLVGLPSANRLQRGLFDRYAAEHPLQAWVTAPDRLATSFDELGFLIPSAWCHAELPFEKDSWQATDSPDLQAARAVRCLAEWSKDLSVEEVVVGVLDEEHRPGLELAFAKHDLTLRRPEGRPVRDSGPARLLRSLCTWLESEAWEDFAMLIRHPDLEATLQGIGAEADIIDRTDRWFEDHLPHRIRKAMSGPSPAGNAVQWIIRLTEEAGFEERLPLHRWSLAFREFLRTIYGSTSLDRRQESERQLARALSAIAQALDAVTEAESCSEKTRFRAGEAVHLLELALAQANIPPGRPVEHGVESVGWLELPLDDAPAVLLTDFREGVLGAEDPASMFLPAALRQRLSMSQAEERWARDVLATSVLLHTRQEEGQHLRILFCRNRAEGDALMPSRLLFQGEGEALATRTLELLGEGEVTPAPASLDISYRPLLPQAGGQLPSPGDDTIFSASRINTYLHSPYEYYLKYVCKLRVHEDSAQELDPLASGNLLHRALEAFGRAEPDEYLLGFVGIYGFLQDWLNDEIRQVYGAKPRAAIRIQQKQMERRLRCFALAQEQRQEQGWFIQEVEWKPETETVKLRFEGEEFLLRGFIDRIDWNPEKDQWRIYDYKTGATRKTSSVFRPRARRWEDVQLPLYLHLAAPMIGLPARDLIAGVPRNSKDARLKIGYFNLPTSDQEWPLETCNGWEPDAMRDLETQVAAAIRGIRAGDFFSAPDRLPRDPQLARIAGASLLRIQDLEMEHD